MDMGEAEMRTFAKNVKNLFRYLKMRMIRKSDSLGESSCALKIPVFRCNCGIYDTIEGCALANCGIEIREAAKKVFEGFTEEQKRRFLFEPCEWEFLERAKYWKEAMSYYLPEKLVHRAMAKLFKQYILIKKHRGRLFVSEFSRPPGEGVAAPDLGSRMTERDLRRYEIMDQYGVDEDTAEPILLDEDEGEEREREN